MASAPRTPPLVPVQERLTATAVLHLQRPSFVPFTASLPSMSPCVLLCGPYGSELYQSALVSALALACKARLLVMDRWQLGLDSAASAAAAEGGEDGERLH